MGQCSSKKSAPVLLADKYDGGAGASNRLLSPQVLSDAKQNATTPMSYVPAGLADDATFDLSKESNSGSHSEGEFKHVTEHGSVQQNKKRGGGGEDQLSSPTERSTKSMSEQQEEDSTSNNDDFATFSITHDLEKVYSKENAQNDHAIIMWDDTTNEEAKRAKSKEKRSLLKASSESSLIISNREHTVSTDGKSHAHESGPLALVPVDKTGGSCQSYESSVVAGSTDIVKVGRADKETTSDGIHGAQNELLVVGSGKDSQDEITRRRRMCLRQFKGQTQEQNVTPVDVVKSRRRNSNPKLFAPQDFAVASKNVDKVAANDSGRGIVHDDEANLSKKSGGSVPVPEVFMPQILNREEKGQGNKDRPKPHAHKEPKRESHPRHFTFSRCVQDESVEGRLNAAIHSMGEVTPTNQETSKDEGLYLSPPTPESDEEDEERRDGNDYINGPSVVTPITLLPNLAPAQNQENSPSACKQAEGNDITTNKNHRRQRNSEIVDALVISNKARAGLEPSNGRPTHNYLSDSYVSSSGEDTEEENSRALVGPLPPTSYHLAEQYERPECPETAGNVDRNQVGGDSPNLEDTKGVMVASLPPPKAAADDSNVQPLSPASRLRAAMEADGPVSKASLREAERNSNELRNHASQQTDPGVTASSSAADERKSDDRPQSPASRLRAAMSHDSSTVPKTKISEHEGRVAVPTGKSTLESNQGAASQNRTLRTNRRARSLSSTRNPRVKNESPGRSMTPLQMRSSSKEAMLTKEDSRDDAEVDSRTSYRRTRTTMRSLSPQPSKENRDNSRSISVGETMTSEQAGNRRGESPQRGDSVRRSSSSSSPSLRQQDPSPVRHRRTQGLTHGRSNTSKVPAQNIRHRASPSPQRQRKMDQVTSRRRQYRLKEGTEDARER